MRTPILPTKIAQEQCQKLIEELDSSSIGKALKQTGHGRMFGVLVCDDGTVLRAFSGMLEGQYKVENFVEPAFDVNDMKALLCKIDKQVKLSSNPKEESKKCWKEVQKLYSFHCFDGVKRKLCDIFPNSPSGTGDCCAPKLLNCAYKLGKKPLSMAEFFYGENTSSHTHLEYYNPCDSRCKELLKYILGLDIEYYDGKIIVVNKPSGVLSIEGKGPDKQDCISSRVKSLYSSCIEQPCIHRLDQATSGLMVLGLTKKSHDDLSLSFEKREVCKTYEALVYGIIEEDFGKIELPIRLDVSNRPYQIIDLENGKNAVTQWEKLSIENRYSTKCTRLKLTPLTGRTHQLRVHCAYGLGHPIVGDSLYGDIAQDKSAKVPRMMLQARYLSFTHPITKETLSFELKASF